MASEERPSVEILRRVKEWVFNRSEESEQVALDENGVLVLPEEGWEIAESHLGGKGE